MALQWHFKGKKKYWCFYPHQSKDLLSPVCSIFTESAQLGRFSNMVTMSMCLSICAIGCSFLRPLISPDITWSVPGLSLVLLPSLLPHPLPPILGIFFKYYFDPCPHLKNTDMQNVPLLKQAFFSDTNILTDLYFNMVFKITNKHNIYLHFF